MASATSKVSVVTTGIGRSKRKTKSFIYETMEYAKNQAKWKAAEEFCADRMIEFKIITEDELGIK